MKINEFLKITTKITECGLLKIRPQVKCNDGFKMSVQASWGHYCTPRKNLMDGQFDTVEIGFPSQEEPLINEYAESQGQWTKTVYGCVPVGIVNAVIKKHGGIVENCWEVGGQNG